MDIISGIELPYTVPSDFLDCTQPLYGLDGFDGLGPIEEYGEMRAISFQPSVVLKKVHVKMRAISFEPSVVLKKAHFKKRISRCTKPVKPHTQKANALKAEAQAAEALKAEAQAAEALKAEALKAEAQAAEALKAEALKAEAWAPTWVCIASNAANCNTTNDNKTHAPKTNASASGWASRWAYWRHDLPALLDCVK